MPEQPAQPTWSLERHISRRLLWVIGSFWLAGSAVSLLGVWHETGKVEDHALEETAERFLFLPEIVMQDAEEQRQFLRGLGPHEEHVVYQVFDASGRMRLRSHGAPETAIDPEGVDGMRYIGGWRVLTLTRSDGLRRVEVAETVGNRLQVLLGTLGWLVVTLAIALPAAFLAMTIVLRRGFRSLEPVRVALAQRAPEDLRPLPDANAPRELQPWLSSVNELMAEVRALVEAERAFAAHTAHELRTPLAAARAKAQRLAELVKDPAVLSHGRALVRQLDRLTRLATRLLQLARLQSAASLRREPVDLVMLARLVVAEFGDAVERERLRVEQAVNRAEVSGDIDALGIALRNLIDNALKHGGAECWVTVLVEPRALYVIDDGPAVPQEMLAKLVRPFERGITAAEGSGLGLSITDAIVRDAGGSLELRSPVLGERGFAAIMLFE